MRRVAIVLLAPLLVTVTRAADVFERHTSEYLRSASETGKAVASLSMQDVGRLPRLAPNLGGPVVVVRTNDGNLAKVVVAWGFRRSGDGLIPVVVLERFVTYRTDRRNVTSASDENVMLFQGFSYNLDIGQVVPEGQGADLTLSPDGKLRTVGEARMVPLERTLLPVPKGKATDPNDHEGVLPRDFSGTWEVDVDGRWKGELTLELDENGLAEGRYTSSESKSTYEVTGRVAALPHRIKLEIELDNVRQAVDAYLWTTDKSRMSGTATLAGRAFGFAATRRTED